MKNLDACCVTTKKHAQVGNFVKIIMIAVAGYAVGKVSEIGVKLIKGKRKQRKQNSFSKKTFRTNGIYSSEDGFELTFGDKFKVLELDDKCAIIRKEGRIKETHKIPITVLKSLIENQ